MDGPPLEGPGPRARPFVLLLAGGAVLAGATAGMLAGVEPFATWYYSFAWYSVLAAAEGVLQLRTGTPFLFRDVRFTLLLFGWSVPFWLSFELLNFRIENWYYVLVPADPVARWIGITLSFATVLPAILVSERLLGAWGVFGRSTGAGVSQERRRRRVLTVRESVRQGGGDGHVSTRITYVLQAVGVAMAAAALARPRLFYPFIWGAATLLLDPWVCRRDPRRSLLGRLAAGRKGLVLRLLLGGLAIGFLWEMFNVAARGKWIYTVPGLEELKLFEMPLAGFLGFPVLALDGWASWQTLRLLGLAGGREKPGTDGSDRVSSQAVGTPRPRRVAVACGLGAALFSAGVLLGMERWTITSYTPDLEDVAGERWGVLDEAGYDVFRLAESEPSTVSAHTGVAEPIAEGLVRRARLITLRGIGSRNAAALADVGVHSVEELARADAEELAARLTHLPWVSPPRVDEWIRSARAATSSR